MHNVWIAIFMRASVFIRLYISLCVHHMDMSAGTRAPTHRHTSHLHGKHTHTRKQAWAHTNINVNTVKLRNISINTIIKPLKMNIKNSYLTF